MTDNEATRTIFRKFPDGEVIALFPDIIAGMNGEILDYVHLGQHGQADYDYVMSITLPATPKEFKPLLDELTNQVGYHCFIVNRKEDIL